MACLTDVRADDSVSWLAVRRGRAQDGVMYDTNISSPPVASRTRRWLLQALQCALYDARELLACPYTLGRCCTEQTLRDSGYGMDLKCQATQWPIMPHTAARPALSAHEMCGDGADGVHRRWCARPCCSPGYVYWQHADHAGRSRRIPEHTREVSRGLRWK